MPITGEEMKSSARESAGAFDIFELLKESVAAEGPTPNGLSIEWLMDQLEAPEAAK